MTDLSRLSEYDFHLPAGRIAQEPVEPRDHARLLRLDRSSGSVTHHRFFELPDLLRPGDLVVLNDTRVVPARVFGRRATGGRVEFLVLPSPAFLSGGNEAEALVSAGGRLQPGERVTFDSPDHAAVLGENHGLGRWSVRFEMPRPPIEWLNHAGKAPLPPYIERPAVGDARATADREQYQTVYAASPGAVAAPTAGLHFTPVVLERLKAKGIRTATITLHVGLGTFLPVRTEQVADHKMLPEPYTLGPEASKSLAEARAEKRRIVAVGTTVTRVLESLALSGRWEPHSGETDLFIHPPFRFRVVEGLITNFHLPKGTPLMLVAAFARLQTVLGVYAHAIEKGYRFFSYGDAMIVV